MTAAAAATAVATAGSTVELGSWGVEGTIREVSHAPTAAEFWRSSVHRWEPLLVRGGAKSMAAFGAWSTEELIERFGNLTVRTERAKEDRRAGSQKGGMTLAELLSPWLSSVPLSSTDTAELCRRSRSALR